MLHTVEMFSSYTHFQISGFYTISYLVKDDTTGMGHRTFNFFSLSDLFLEHKTYLHILLWIQGYHCSSSIVTLKVSPYNVHFKDIQT